MKYKIVLVDLDEIVFDSSQRIQKATINGVIDWDLALDNEMVKYDPVIEGAVEAVNQIADMGFQICYLTGRMCSCQDGTLKALNKAGFPDGWLEMRNYDDLRPVHVIKGKVIERFMSHGDKRIVAAVDDDYSGTARDMYISYEIPHFYDFDSLIEHLERICEKSTSIDETVK